MKRFPATELRAAKNKPSKTPMTVTITPRVAGRALFRLGFELMPLKKDNEETHWKRRINTKDKIKPTMNGSTAIFECLRDAVLFEFLLR